MPHTHPHSTPYGHTATCHNECVARRTQPSNIDYSCLIPRD